MPTTYNGNAAGITARQTVSIQNPADGDGLDAASNNAGQSALANYLAYLQAKAALLDQHTNADDVIIASNKNFKYGGAVARQMYVLPTDFVPTSTDANGTDPEIGGDAATARQGIRGNESNVNRTYLARLFLPPLAIITGLRFLYYNNSGSAKTLNARIAHVDYNAGGAEVRTQVIPSIGLTMPNGGSTPTWLDGHAITPNLQAPADGWTEFWMQVPGSLYASDLAFMGARVAYTHTLVAPVR